jgi:hypothetical protein
VPGIPVIGVIPGMPMAGIPVIGRSIVIVLIVSLRPVV